MTTLSVVEGDITGVATDVIVNAANSALVPGGGVDGAIHRAGGPSIRADCEVIIRNRGRLETGEAVITGAGRLPARHVIHTVGPIWGRLEPAEATGLLAACYRNSLALAVANNCRTIAFPNISTGAFGFPIALAAATAVGAVRKWLTSHAEISELIFVCFDAESARLYRAELAD